MGMENTQSMVPICIHTLIKPRDVEDDIYAGFMSILQRTNYNNITIESKWKKIMELRGYEDGLVIDDSGVAENFMINVYPNYYKEIQLR